jgi:uncharacterized protein (DUF488 family)
VEISTVGFAGHSAESFFGGLITSGVRQLVDVRIHNVSQLAGFAKRDDLRYFLRNLGDIEYVHEPRLAPTPELLKQYREKQIAWPEYEREFLALMIDRRIESLLSPDLFAAPTVLLCSEHTPDHCHRRLVAEYLQDHWGNVTIRHL